MSSPVVVIKPVSKWYLLNLKELWRYRDLFYIFTWRDLKVRYKQTILGILWAVFQPLSQTFIFTVFFGNLAKIPSNDLPYPVFVLIGLVFWQFFSGALVNASNSMVNNESIIKKVYFPREILPFSAVLTSFVDFIISAILLVALMLYYHIYPNIQLLWILPLVTIITFLASTGGGMLLAALNVKYRDIRYLLPFFIQTLIFLTPVIYPTTIIRPSNRLIMAINPMSGVIESVRSTVSGMPLNLDTLIISIVTSILIYFMGLAYFKLTERYFADIV